jgi:hypothetical protein
MRMAAIVGVLFLAWGIGFGGELRAKSPDAKSPPPRLLNLYRLDSGLPPLPRGFYRTRLFAFSPDEEWIAVVEGSLARQVSAPVRAPESRLLLLPVHPSGDQAVQINQVQSSQVQIGPGMPEALYWSPDSRSVAVQAIPATRSHFNAGTFVTKVYNLRGELLWTGPPSGRIMGFVEPGRLLAEHAFGKAGFDTIDMRTSAVTAWPASRHWRFGAINPDRHLVAMFPDTERTKTLIVDYATGKVLRSIKNQLWLDPFRGLEGAPSVYFAEHGKAVCFAARDFFNRSRFDDYPICQDVDTGRTIAELKTAGAGAPADASSGGTRMILTRLNYFPSSGYMTYGGNVVWDFRSGAEIAAWKPQDLAGALPTVAMSSSGKYVALGSGDELQIFDLP